VGIETGAEQMTKTTGQRIDTIVTHAWEIWTKNGLGLDDEDRRETEKTVQDAVNNEYQDDISDVDWLAATLLRLRGRS
jgi:hypothetical protein